MHRKKEKKKKNLNFKACHVVFISVFEGLRVRKVNFIGYLQVSPDCRISI